MYFDLLRRITLMCVGIIILEVSERLMMEKSFLPRQFLIVFLIKVSWDP